MLWIVDLVDSMQLHHIPLGYEDIFVGCHCAKVKGPAELKIERPRVKTISYDFPKLHQLVTTFLFVGFYRNVVYLLVVCEYL